MSGDTTGFVGSIPEIYDSRIGPYLFDHPGADLARRVHGSSPDARMILEVAAGTGIATRHLRSTFSERVRIVATDFNQAMLDYAALQCNGLDNITFQQADALDLPFGEDSFDVVACQFGIMFFPDKARGLADMVRVLRPGDTLAFSVWDSLSLNPVIETAFSTIAAHFDDDPPAFLDVPFSCHEIDSMKQLVQDAGFANLEIGVVRWRIEANSALDLARGLVEGNPGIQDIRARATAAPEAVVDAVAAAIRERHGDQPVRSPLQAIVFVARNSS